MKWINLCLFTLLLIIGFNSAHANELALHKQRFNATNQQFLNFIQKQIVSKGTSFKSQSEHLKKLKIAMSNTTDIDAQQRQCYGVVIAFFTTGVSKTSMQRQQYVTLQQQVLQLRNAAQKISQPYELRPLLAQQSILSNIPITIEESPSQMRNDVRVLDGRLKASCSSADYKDFGFVIEQLNSMINNIENL